MVLLLETAFIKLEQLPAHLEMLFEQVHYQLIFEEFGE
jgi:hypothetical protein